MWKGFIFEKNLDPELNPIIKESWQRSLFYEVDPYKRKGERTLTYFELEQLKKDRGDFYSIALAVMENLYSFVKGSGFLVILCTENGFLIKVIGDEEPLRNARSIDFVEGADWSEESMGTNAIGTCLKTNRPVQVYGAEHFTQVCQSWTCSAAPIHDPSGKLIGILNMSGPFERVHSHTLGMVVSAVQAIEQQMKLIEKSRKNEVMQSYIEATINTLTDGVLITNQQGLILKANNSLLRLSGLSELQIVGQTLDILFEEERIIDKALDCPKIINEEVNVKQVRNGQLIPCLLHIKPIYDQDGQWMGSLISLNEVKSVRKFVNEITGSQAKVTFTDIVGSHPLFMECIKEAKLAARTASTVLLMGNSGTGKDLFAQAIHQEGGRSHKPFIAINCGAVPRDLLGSELFGYVEGAFTGARKGGSAGKFELADGGTLFLDEIGEMSLEMQVLLLRVLQNREVIRMGGHRVIPVDVRIISATNKDLEEEMRKGHFREDLFYRLNVMPIKIPALRQRKEDISLLAKSFCQKLSQRLNRDIRDISPELIRLLEGHDWPGNVRELQNVLERTILRSEGTVLLPQFLPAELQSWPRVEKQEDMLSWKEEMKKQALLQSIQECKGNLKKAATLLGISRSTLYRQMERYGLRSSF
ncbi:sigma-54-dependent Fis family transcriptional regulator [Aneurinibacillus sp. Ricciae_BoGa-3]|nr:sigma-54-dependent Fis family transcriptional regulator [Aneurinibacillus sp. Ricciae_BoGa-3]WCK56893.1 sigma-54-dependent Fis family transcriptional regulator [Aneurinibacillus sp. Ricciae_BoGa-3]